MPKQLLAVPSFTAGELSSRMQGSRFSEIL